MRQGKDWGNWSEKRLLRFMVGFHVFDGDQLREHPFAVQALGSGDLEVAAGNLFSRFTPRKLVEHVKQTGSEVFYFYAKGGFGNCFYPTRYGHIHTATRGRDWVAEITEACIEADMVPVALYEHSDSRLPVEHPDWCHRRNGRPSGFCCNSPYGDILVNQVREILERYPLGALYVDMLDYPDFAGVECASCSRIYREEIGIDLRPEEEMEREEYIRYLDWRAEQIVRIMRRLRAVRDEVAPGCLLEHNFHGIRTPRLGHRFRNTRDLMDSFTSDPFPFRDGAMVDLAWSKLYRRAHPRKRSWLLSDTAYTNFKGSRFDVSTPRPFDFYVSQAATLLANGVAFCSSTCIEADGGMDATQAEVIRRLNAHFKPKMPWLVGADPVPYAAIVFPSRARDVLDRQHQGDYLVDFLGWARMLTESHVVYDMLVDDLLTPDLLKSYRVLLLPNAEILSGDQAEMVRGWVAAGGTLIATAHTSLAGYDGEPLEDFSLGDVLGVSLTARRNGAQPTHIYVGEDELQADDAAITPWVFVPDGQVRVAPGPETEALARVIEQAPEALSFTRRRTDAPAITRHPFGQGVAYYVASRLGLVYARGQQYTLQLLVERLLKKATPDMPVVVAAHPAVQVEVARQPAEKRVVVHLINRQGGSGWSIALNGPTPSDFSNSQPHRMLPIFRIPVRARKDLVGAVRKVYLAPEGVEIPFEADGDHLHAVVPRLDVHAMLVWE